MNTNFFDKEQLLDLENANIGEKDDTEDMELEVIDVATREKRNGFWIVREEHRWEVLHQYHASEVAGPQRR